MDSKQSVGDCVDGKGCPKLNATARTIMSAPLVMMILLFSEKYVLSSINCNHNANTERFNKTYLEKATSEKINTNTYCNNNHVQSKRVQFRQMSIDELRPSQATPLQSTGEGAYIRINCVHIYR